MTRIPAHDIASQFPSILSRVAQGEEFVVTDHGQAVAKIVPATAAGAQPDRGSWQSQFEDWMRAVGARASRYPAGVTLDDSRETIYDGRGA
jgi:antitoxin (DNA-binding transcriptional repressor) of toxin-antitoxin stability system